MFQTGNAVNVTGTSLKGYLVSTREELTKVFGKPVDYAEGDKVTTEWKIKFDNEVIACIYDWKRYSQGKPADNELYDWHIAGSSQDAVSLVKDAVHRSNTNVIA